MELTKKCDIVRVKNDKVFKTKDKIIREVPFTLFVNKKQIIKFVCTPEYIKDLAIGYLFSQGLLKNIEDIEEMKVNKNIIKMKIKDFKLIDNKKSIMTSGERSFSNNKNNFDKVKMDYDFKKIKPKEIYKVANDLFNCSTLHAETGGVHNAALINLNNTFNEFRKDVGRHNTIDKLVGYCLLNNVLFNNKILVFSGRISSEIIKKVAKAKIPMIISVSAPTDLAIKIGKKYNITLVGFVRGKKMNIYNDPGRIDLKN
ncbi:MAG: formate dehydrogenase accessory sulfurtransferase FdhD [Bacillota bacterium]